MSRRCRHDALGLQGALSKSIAMIPPAKTLVRSDIPRARSEAHARVDYRLFRSVPTRWGDNDIYGHVNNVVYYSWFDTAVNALLIERGVLDIHHGTTVGFVAETHCNYFAALAYPQTIDVGLRVAHIGTSSVRYEIGLFAESIDSAAAQGHLVHVYVNRQSGRPVPLPATLRQVLDELRIPIPQ